MTEQADWQIEWQDHGREPQCEPNPNYPDGVDIDISHGTNALKTCYAQLKHPAPRCGAWRVVCRTCDQRAMVTTAGRTDDPRSLRLPCKNRGKLL